jgi:hypothetical protein
MSASMDFLSLKDNFRGHDKKSNLLQSYPFGMLPKKFPYGKLIIYLEIEIFSNVGL